MRPSSLCSLAIIDAAWSRGIKPLLLQRFPGSTSEELQQAHAFAYGGAIIQDMGYCLLRLVPKVGPFSALAFRPPTPAVEQLYMHSFNETLEHYRGMLVAQGEGRLQLPNENFDTGELTKPTA
jgi:hypothetical protein